MAHLLNYLSRIYRNLLRLFIPFQSIFKTVLRGSLILRSFLFMESEDYQKCREGDLFEPLNKIIRVLIIATENYIVFLDEEYYVEWYEFEPCTYPECYSVIMDQVAYLETVSASHFADSTGKSIELREFRRLLGEAVARVYDDDEEAALRMVGKAHQLLLDRSSERARLWYLGAAAFACVPFVFLLCLLWIFRSKAEAALGTNAFQIMIGASCGAIGALISVIIGVRKVNLNASSGAWLHWVDGIARIFVGCIGASLLVLAIKANLILGILAKGDQSSPRLVILMALSIVAGASERVVPSLIQNLESSTIAGMDPKVSSKEQTTNKT